MAWLTGWNYRKSHIMKSAAGAGTNYQVRIHVYYGVGLDSGEDVYTNSHCKADFGDIRFTTDDGETLLDYWNENNVASDNALFWVEVAGNLTVGDVTIYVYYGKAGELTTSNGTNTFLFFDDFPGVALDTVTNWTLQEGVASVASSVLTMTAHSSISSKVAQGKGRLRTKMQIVTDGDWWCGWQQTLHAAHWCIIDGINQPANKWGGSINNGVNHLAPSYANDANWHTWDIVWTTNYEEWFQDDSTKGSLAFDTANTLYFWLEAYSVAGSMQAKWDWIFRAKYVNPEPAHDIWGLEESLGVAAWLGLTNDMLINCVPH
jgi:hypothetical protein